LLNSDTDLQKVGAGKTAETRGVLLAVQSEPKIRRRRSGAD
jgi:hypothetical protein